METPIYLFTGFLESGKTTLIQAVVEDDPDFLEDGATLLLLCEEGEIRYPKDFLQRHNIIVHQVEDKEQLCPSFWEDCRRVYRPRQVIIEYNGTWEIDALGNSGIPEDWPIDGIYSTVNAVTAELYLQNMRKMFMEQLKVSNLIIFNRCTDELDRLKFRRNLKVLNPEVQIAFEKADGTMYGNQQEELPFDYSGRQIELDDMDYGLWYLDAMEHPERYIGKEISFTARFCASAKPGQPYFVPGRHVMTCCEEDIQFLGFICEFDREPEFKHGDWVHVTAVFGYQYMDMYREEGPVLELVRIEKAKQPEPELVFFV